MANLQKYIFQKIFFALWTKIECAEFEPWILIYYGSKLVNIHKNIKLHMLSNLFMANLQKIYISKNNFCPWNEK